jgi:hypothetical protein
MNPEKPSDPNLKSELDRQIEALLAVEPPPEYPARLRRRIARSPEPRVWSFRWMFAAAALAAAVVAAYLIVPAHETHRAETPVVARGVVEVPAVAKAPEIHATETHASSRPHKTRTGPQVLIDPREAFAMRRVLEGTVLRAPAAFSESSPAEPQTSALDVAPLAVPAPLEIDPIGPPSPVVVEGVGQGEL